MLIMTSSNGNIFRVTGHLYGEFTGPLSVNSPHKGQWRRALMFPLICVWINDWVNNREAGVLRRYLDHYDVSVMGEIDTVLLMDDLIWGYIWQEIRVSWFLHAISNSVAVSEIIVSIFHTCFYKFVLQVFKLYCNHCICIRFLRIK